MAVGAWRMCVPRVVDPERSLAGFLNDVIMMQTISHFPSLGGRENPIKVITVLIKRLCFLVLTERFHFSSKQNDSINLSRDIVVTSSLNLLSEALSDVS